MKMEHTVDPSKKLFDELGPTLKNYEIFHNEVLVAVYIRPEKTKTGIVLPDHYRDEDRFQSKVGLLVAKGPDAFVDPSGKWFRGLSFDVGDWLIFRPSDGWNVTVNGVLCRQLIDTSIKGRIKHPDEIW